MLQATIGFGFPVFAMIFLVMLFPFATAVTITQFAGLLGVGYFFLKYRNHVHWKVLFPFLIPAMALGAFLTWYSMSIPVAGLKICLGLVLIAIALLLMFGRRSISVKPSWRTGSLLGAISGLLNGLFAVGGPPVALYLLPATDDTISYIASANAYFFLFKLVSLPIRFSQGAIAIEHLGYLFVSLLSMTVGTLIGDRIMRSLRKALLERLVYLFVAFSGVVIMLQEVL